MPPRALRSPAASRHLPAAFGLIAVALGLALATPIQARQPAAPAEEALRSLVTRALDAPELNALAAGLIDSIGGRLPGTAAGEAAEAWATRWLGSFGFDSVWLERVDLPVWRHERTRIEVAGPAGLAGRKLVAIALGYSAALSADSVPVVDIGRGDPRTLAGAGASVRDAALLADVVTPDLIDAAIRAGAVAILRITSEPGRLPRARVAPVSDPPARIALASLSYEDGLWLRRASAEGTVHVGIRLEAETVPGTAHNVVAEWRGSDPLVRDDAVVVGAHLDAWDAGDGAIDNGTGVLTAVTAAAGFPLEDVRPRRSVRLVLFAAEELGLLGSRAYVRAHRETLGTIVAMMNLDMVGAPSGYGATGHPEADTLFERIVRSDPLRPLELDPSVDHGGGAGSDHQPFLLGGVPTIYVRTSLPPESLRWYHNAGDTFDKIDLESVRRSAAAAAAAIWALADHPDRPLKHLGPQETRELIRRLGW